MLLLKSAIVIMEKYSKKKNQIEILKVLGLIDNTNE